jgi:hypothetical protein
MIEPYDIRKKVELYGIITLIALAVLYGAFRAYPLIIGPQITITSPHEGDTVASTTFEIVGSVSRVKEITIQGRAVPVDENGHFDEILVAESPYTIIVVTATDAYGAKVTKTLHVTPKDSF